MNQPAGTKAIDAQRDPRDRLIVALDVSSVDEAERAVADFGDAVSFYKIGHQLFYRRGGLEFTEALAAGGKRVFLDLKLLDIDNTVGHGVESVLRLGATFLTIHAYPNAMRAAVTARAGRPLALLGVTVLTSMDDDDLKEAGYAFPAESLVKKRAQQAQQIGMSGIICSAGEASALRQLVGPDFLLVTPGIRPAGTERGDQKRVMTPADAISAGADYLVVGRPIMTHDNPRQAALEIVSDIADALRT